VLKERSKRVDVQAKHGWAERAQRTHNLASITHTSPPFELYESRHNLWLLIDGSENVAPQLVGKGHHSGRAVRPKPSVTASEHRPSLGQMLPSVEVCCARCELAEHAYSMMDDSQVRVLEQLDDRVDMLSEGDRIELVEHSIQSISSRAPVL